MFPGEKQMSWFYKCPLAFCLEALCGLTHKEGELKQRTVVLLNLRKTEKSGTNGMCVRGVAGKIKRSVWLVQEPRERMKRLS